LSILNNYFSSQFPYYFYSFWCELETLTDLWSYTSSVKFVISFLLYYLCLSNDKVWSLLEKFRFSFRTLFYQVFRLQNLVSTQINMSLSLSFLGYDLSANCHLKLSYLCQNLNAKNSLSSNSLSKSVTVHQLGPLSII